MWTNTATYGFTFKDDHNFSFLLGQEIFHDEDKTNFQQSRYFPRSFEAKQAWANMGFGAPQDSYTSMATPERTASSSDK